MNWAGAFATLGILAATVAWLPWSAPMLVLLYFVWRRS